MLTTQLQLPLDVNNKKKLFQLKKSENLMRYLTVLLSEKLQECWLCSHTFMTNSPLVAIGDRVAHPGSRRCGEEKTRALPGIEPQLSSPYSGRYTKSAVLVVSDLDTEL
jgi:hypothetical protein